MLFLKKRRGGGEVRMQIYLLFVYKFTCYPFSQACNKHDKIAKKLYVTIFFFFSKFRYVIIFLSSHISLVQNVSQKVQNWF